MKTTAYGSTVRALRSLFVALLIPITAAVSTAADDLNAVFEEGKAAYYRGDLEVAEHLLKQVEAADPRHIQTKALLAQIKLAIPDDGLTLRKKYAAVRIPKLDVADSSLADCLQALSIMGRNASGGKLQPNLLLMAQGKADAKVTLSLTDVPLPEAIEYVARLTGTKAHWEKHAVVIKSLAD